MIDPALHIHTERFCLRLPQPSDLPDLFAIHSVDAVNRYLPYTTWLSMDDAQAWYQRAQQRMEKNECLQWVLCAKDNGAVVGSCILFHFDWDSGVAEIGYALAQHRWRQGVMREALCGLIDYAFATLQLRRLEAEVDVRNLASHHFLLNLGFVHEGTRRQNRLMKGEIKDSHVYGLLHSEWRP